MSGFASVKLRPFLIAWSICLLLIELLGAGFARSGTDKGFDFRSFYAAGYLIRTNPGQLYDPVQQDQVQNDLISAKKGFLPFYHLDYEALVYAPFSKLNYRAAYLAFITLNMFLVMAAFFTAFPAFSSSQQFWKLPLGSLLFAFVPLLVALTQGQDSILLLLFCCLTWRFLKSENDLAAAAFLALALFKFQIAIPIAVLISIRRGWRFVGGFLIASAAVVLFCLVIVGHTGIIALFHFLSGAGSAIDTNATAQYRMSVFPLAMPNLVGFLFACGGRFLPSASAFNIVSGACALGLFIWCASAIRRCELNVAISIAILCGILVSYHLYIHDLTLSILPILLLRGRAHRYLSIALFGLPIILFPFGVNSFFLLAVPVLVMLINAIAFEASTQPISPENIRMAPA